jgi:hypothetical protein
LLDNALVYTLLGKELDTKAMAPPIQTHFETVYWRNHPEVLKLPVNILDMVTRRIAKRRIQTTKTLYATEPK